MTSGSVAPDARSSQADPADALNRALALHGAGHIAEAAALYQAVLATRPDHPDALRLLGIALHQLGNAGAAANLLAAAVQLYPRMAPLYLALAQARAAVQGDAAGRPALQAAIILDPAYPAALVTQAGLLLATGQAAAAETWLRRTVALQPDFAAARNNLGNLLQDRGESEAAAAQYLALLAHQPENAPVLYNLANVRRGQGRLTAAVALYRVALQIDPAAAPVLDNLGNALLDLGDLPAALASLRRASLTASDDARIRCDLAGALAAAGLIAEAHQAFLDASILDAGDFRARLGRCITTLPVIYRQAGDIAAARGRYAAELATLAGDVAAGRIRPDRHAIGSIQPFALPYQGEDDRDLQAIYGEMICRIAAAAPAPAVTAPPATAVRTGRRLRVGFVSGYFRRHTVWHLFGGWLNLDPERFELSGYYTGAVRDAATAAAAARFDGRLHQGSADTLAARISADRPDVLIYPEIGMDPGSLRLAADRLAPVQAVSWGHPQTTGLPTIDAFLSSDAMEPPDAQRYYTERLIRLPNLSLYYQPPEVEDQPFDLAAAGVRHDAVRYLCCQSLFKYLPDYDGVLPAIAARVPNAQFLFIGHHAGAAATTAFRQRLDIAFALAGLDAARHLVMLPRLSAGAYAWLNRQCDIFLDSIGWSGGNTVLEALTLAALPVVTLPGRFLRGRHAAAMLHQAGLEDTIAADLSGYVDLAVALGQSAERRATLTARTRTQRHRLYQDAGVLTGLADWLHQAAG